MFLHVVLIVGDITLVSDYCYKVFSELLSSSKVNCSKWDVN